MSRIQLFAAAMLVLGADILLARAQDVQSNHVSVWAPMFKSQVKNCWKRPKRGSESPNFEAAFIVWLNRDGSFARPPVPESQTIPDSSKAYQQAGLEALVKCQPYNLPIEFYDEWKHFVPVFTEPKFTS
jgi:colicin import membrane protein